MSKATLLHGDCLDHLRSLPDCSVDSVVTDPPAGISFMGKEWDSNKGGRDGWVAWLTLVMQEALRVLKPGGHALVWAIPRTSHWTATAVEDAGFEVRDVITHHFGSGFPKSMNVGKAIDKAAGAKREVVGWNSTARIAVSSDERNLAQGKRENLYGAETGCPITAPATPEAQKWEGWGTALKPASEHWILARKPFKGTVASNVLEYGTGALNIDGCRIESNGDHKRPFQPTNNERTTYGVQTGFQPSNKEGRWPANLILSHSDSCEEVAEGAFECEELCPVYVLDTQSGNLKSGKLLPGHKASRFFYVAKPSKRERNEGLDGLVEKESATRNEGGRRFNPICDNTGQRIQVCPCGDHKWSTETNPKAANHHPTVKSIKLMGYLCRLITPPGGIVLDPFMGSGSTGVAALKEGFGFIGIEADPEYIEIARARVANASGEAA